MHENNIEFLDHSPGNTLIKLNEGDYQFYLVDLNRMNFKTLSLEERIKNFARLTPNKQMVEVMSEEYARLINKPKEEIFRKCGNTHQIFRKNFTEKSV